MSAALILLVLAAVVLLVQTFRPRTPDPDPVDAADLAWVRSLKSGAEGSGLSVSKLARQHDVDLDQAVEIGNYDRFKEWEREVAA